MADSVSTTTRFDNLSNRQLADALGRADAISKAAEAELKAHKDELKRRGLTEVAGNEFTVTATEQIAGRLDSKAIKTHLGEAYHRFELPVISTVVRVKAVNRLALAA